MFWKEKGVQIIIHDGTFKLGMDSAPLVKNVSSGKYNLKIGSSRGPILVEGGVGKDYQLFVASQLNQVEFTLAFASGRRSFALSRMHNNENRKSLASKREAREATLPMLPLVISTIEDISTEYCT